jgi:uncharacterized protein (TIGR02453 family)
LSISFPAEGLAFLRGLGRNNRREWFQARKDIYESHVKAPMLALVEAVNHELRKFAPEHVNEPAKAIYRIYRDTRFSSDKTPYKTHVSAIFPRRGFEKHSSGGFYFEISPKAVGIAAGVYMPGPEELLAIRIWMAEHHQEFQKAARKAERHLGPLQGEALRRVPKGFHSDHPAADLLRQKQWYFWKELDPSTASSPKFVQEVVGLFRAAAPVIALLNAPLKAQKKAKGAANWLL